MFMGKGSNDFTKHLPDEARQSLIHKGEGPDTSIALRISAFTRAMATEGDHVETFDAGPNLLVSEKLESHERTEIAVEHDSLVGENDEIELSVHIYKDGQPQFLPVVPRLIFTLKQEKEIWMLIEITLAVHASLTDSDYLAGLRNEQDKFNESAARRRVSVIADAENAFAAAHEDRGYSCALSELFPSADNSDSAGPEGAPGFASEEASGYHFALFGCSGSPATKYRIVALPLDTDSHVKMFCADQAGVVKAAAVGKTADCFRSGEAVYRGSVE
jgi:hypothetical protein